jgi:hypothetical protein
VDVRGDLRVLLDLPADLAAGQLAGVKVDIRPAGEDVWQLRAWMWAASRSSAGSTLCVPVKSRPLTVTVNDRDVIALSRKNAA